MNSAVVAGRLGPVLLAAMINPRGTATALDTYRRCFVPGPHPSGIGAPFVLVAVSVTVAETEAAAARLRASLEIFDLQLSRGIMEKAVPTADAAIERLGGLPEPTTYVPGDWAQRISATPAWARELAR
ncbi:hypothetical protein [Streptomyces sp. DSM 40750]|uniref:hypothetical protein n=1 Tax=Streptomyces sp. DSM 40750 TaxID=2801030 RepID=UPI00214C91D0|nr:hypothetical protein [Streptomyces sp. DSM 40750]UUU19718.1 hypothetical protein JIX55_05035 [Streptomyces sp. DSM 40750]